MNNKKTRYMSAALYCYTTPGIATKIKKMGMEQFGSYSAFITYVLAKELKDTKTMAAVKTHAAKRKSPFIKNAKKPTKGKKMPKGCNTVTTSTPQA